MRTCKNECGLKLVLIMGLAIAGCGSAPAPAPQCSEVAEPPAGVSAGWRSPEFTNDSLRARGLTRTAGGQWFRSLTWAQADPKFLLWGTDVGGVFRSTDGGENWEPCNVGYLSRGASALAVDPRNPLRVVAVGTNSATHPYNGIYLSADQAASWRLVKEIDQSLNQDVGRQALAFDFSSYDPALGYCRVVYWSQLEEDAALFGAVRKLEGGLWKSSDGGETWGRVPGSDVAGSAHLAVHPSTGALVAANRKGVHRSSDGGATWVTTWSGVATGLSRCHRNPDHVWISVPDGAMVSRDDGLSWERVTGADGLARAGFELHNLAVSPADPQRLVLARRGPKFQFERFYSGDGGSSWKAGRVAKDDNLVPTNAREGAFAWHPEDGNVLLSTGGDYPALSRDGGATYARAGNGVSNILVGSSFNFSFLHPEVLVLALQDYGVIWTVDGGRGWAYASPGNLVWGGFNYGGFSPDGRVLVAGDAPEWVAPRQLMISRDGGVSWRATGLEMEKDPVVSFGSTRNPAVIFAGGHRSADGGQTWKRMDRATHVLAADPVNGTLWGLRRARLQGVLDAVVRSDDDGATWEDAMLAQGRVSDLAWDHERGRLYLVEDHRLRIWQDGAYQENPILPRDEQGELRVRSVAVDPQDTRRVFVAANRDVFASSVGALASMDAGQTWVNLNLNRPLEGGRQDGGRESHWVRVHPRSGEAWFASSCYGVWIWREEGR